MGILQNIFNKAAVDEDTTEETIRRDMTFNELESFFTGTSNVSNSKLTSTTYYACMLIRCNAVAKLPLKVLIDDGNGTQSAKKHELYRLLKRRPNSFTNSHDFLWATEFQRLEYGDAFWYPHYDSRGKIKALYLLDSRRMRIGVDSTGTLAKDNPIYYVYGDVNHGETVYMSDEIVHFKNFAMNGVHGTSIKKYLNDTIENEQYATNVLKERYKNGLQDPLIVQYTGDFSNEVQRKIRSKFESLGGAKNAGKVVPIPTEFKVDQLETKLVNSQFFELQGLTARHIANAFGVKSFQLNDLEKSTYTNIEQQNKAFYGDTLQNVLTTYEQEMEYKLLTIDEQFTHLIRFNVDSILRSDLSARTESYAKAISSGYMSIAEVRRKEDLPYIEGTDELIIGNGASIHLKELGKQYEKGGDNNK